MQLDVVIEETFPHPIEAVWAALTDAHEHAVWLMRSDFEPRVGKRFSFHAESEQPGWRGWVDCTVLELDPPRRMVWSWVATDDGMATTVTFELAGIDGGTQLTLRHEGDTNASFAAFYGSGWPVKLGDLRRRLAGEI